MQGYKLIQLENGGVAIVDADDYAELSNHRWFKSPHGYAMRQGWSGPQTNSENHWTVWMHRVVNKTPDGLFTDHSNGNKLDNRKCNLRTCNKAQNSANRPKIKRSQLSSKFKGVSFHRSTGFWRARITDGDFSKTTYHRTEEQAALDYNRMAVGRFGEFSQGCPVDPSVQPTQRKPKLSKYRGIGRSRNGKWTASIYPKNKEVQIGTFKTEEEAAAAYNVAAAAAFGDKVKLNVFSVR